MDPHPGSDLADYVGQLERKVAALDARLKRVETPLTTYTAGRIPAIYARLDELNDKLEHDGIRSESGITLESRDALLHELSTYAKISAQLKTDDQSARL